MTFELLHNLRNYVNIASLGIWDILNAWREYIFQNFAKTYVSFRINFSTKSKTSIALSLMTIGNENIFVILCQNSILIHLSRCSYLKLSWKLYNFHYSGTHLYSGTGVDELTGLSKFFHRLHPVLRFMFAALFFLSIGLVILGKIKLKNITYIAVFELFHS